MKRVNTCFTIGYTPEQYERAREFVEDMKRHPKRIYWRTNRGKSDEELILSHIAHRILSGYYNQYDPITVGRHVINMKSAQDSA
ncbi:MAG: hypothetical protein P8X57_01880 [Cyclobacteriaceae bacterium]